MNIRKFPIDSADAAAVERAFAAVEEQHIDCCNWPKEFPYAPKVSFRIFHTGEKLLLRFDVSERYTAARVTEDNGEVWTDSCVEFFIALDKGGYYNFETTCIGHLLLGYRRSRNEGVEHALQALIDTVQRTTTLPREPFAEREGNNHWSLTLAIPPQVLFRHALTSWDDLDAQINLFKCGDKLSHPHFLSWQPIRAPKPDFHLPEFFEQVKFTK